MQSPTYPIHCECSVGGMVRGTERGIGESCSNSLYSLSLKHPCKGGERHESIYSQLSYELNRLDSRALVGNPYRTTILNSKPYVPSCSTTHGWAVWVLKKNKRAWIDGHAGKRSAMVKMGNHIDLPSSRNNSNDVLVHFSSL